MKSGSDARRDAGPRGQDERLLGNQGHGCEIGRGIVGRLLVDELHLGIGRLAAEQQLIAVGSARATRAAPVMLPAPGTFSTTTCWPRMSESAAA